MPLERITVFCFAASYAVALLLELAFVLRAQPVIRIASTVFGAAGLLAHTLYLAFHRPVMPAAVGSPLLLSWILAVFYLYGSVRHGRRAWGLFALPIVLILIAQSAVNVPHREDSWIVTGGNEAEFWLVTHWGLLLLGAVGICVGFFASLMYLLQAHRLRAKTPPDRGLKLLSLERLEQMNDRAITLAFPLLTAGVGIGLSLMLTARPASDWRDPKILGSIGIWLIFAVLVVLRRARRLRGRPAALMTILAFVLFLVTLASSHTAARGGGP